MRPPIPATLAGNDETRGGWRCETLSATPQGIQFVGWKEPSRVVLFSMKFPAVGIVGTFLAFRLFGFSYEEEAFTVR
jgi:hypothetical protein